MKIIKISLLLLLVLPCMVFSQQIFYSEPQFADGKEMNFEIIGKLKDRVLIFKNVRWKYTVSIHNTSMELVENVDLDFIPGKTFNVDFIAYPDYVYCIYQYFTKGVVHCMWVKLDASGKKITEPAEIDNSDVGAFGDTKVYNVIRSDDKRFIMIFKMLKKRGDITFESFLLNNDFKEQKHNRLILSIEDQREEYGNFLLDNDGDLVFTKTEKSGSLRNIGQLTFYSMKQNTAADSLISKEINISGNRLADVNLKIDNSGKKYLLTSFYYLKRKNLVDGLFVSVWDKSVDSSIVNKFTPLNDSIRSIAYSAGNSKTAFNDFYIKNIIVKKDGSFIIVSEEFVTKRSNNFNRTDLLFNSPFRNPYGYNYYNPYYYNPYYYNRYYGSYFRNSDNDQNVSYYYNNILVSGFYKNGEVEWNSVIVKDQEDDANDNYISFLNTTVGGEIHFLFNEVERKKLLISDYSISPDGTTRKSSMMRMQDKGYEFMPQYGKQISARQVIIPCTYRNIVCFAKIEF